MNAGGAILEGSNLHFAYAMRHPAVAGVSLSFPRGAVGGLIGANGCGKSTLIRLLAGVLAPSQGEVRFDGAALSSIEPRLLAKRIAYVAQSTPRTFPFTAMEVVLTGRSPYIPRFRFENSLDVEKAWAALEAVGIADLAQRRVTELSGGERQLVSVARALAQEPECLLLDEPSSSLDLKHRADLIRMLFELRRSKGLSVLMVTHDLSLLDPGFDLVFAMSRGRIAVQGCPSAVLRDGVLAEIYGDGHVRTSRVDGRTFVWSEV